jgi:Ca2+-binding RTX toxin-like protein
MSYFATIDAVFGASKLQGTTFQVGNAISTTDVKLYPDNPTDGVQSTSFVDSQGASVWLEYTDSNGNTQLVECILTHGSNRIGSGSTAEDIWVLQISGSSDYLIITSNGYTATPGTSEQINASISLADLDQLVREQPKPATTVSQIDISADSGVDGDFITNVATQTITASLNSSLALGETLLGSVDGGLTWTNITSFVDGTAINWTGVTLVDGMSSIQFKVQNAWGDGPVADQSYLLDTAVAALGVALVNDTGSSDSDGVTKDGTLNVTGTEAGATVWYSIDDGETWSSDFTAAEGDNTVLVRQIDLAGNVSAATPLSFTLDTGAPVAMLSGIDISDDTGIDGDFVTTIAVQTVTATLSAALGSSDRLLGSANGGETWTDITGFVDGTSLSWTNVLLTGTSSLQFRFVDLAGNDGSFAQQDYALTQEPEPAPGPEYAVHRDGIDFMDPALPYTGPVAGLEYYWYGTDRPEAVRGTLYNDFIALGAGDDAADGGAGNDVLDGGTGSNFLTGGSGKDIFFVDARGGKVTWSTITDWESGEQLSLWGWQHGISSATWVDNAGVDGWTGVTMHGDIDGNGSIDTSITWTGLTRDDIPVPTQTVVEGTGLLWFG